MTKRKLGLFVVFGLIWCASAVVLGCLALIVALQKGNPVDFWVLILCTGINLLSVVRLTKILIALRTEK